MALRQGGPTMKIYYEDNHVIVIDKPQNEVVQKDITNDLDTLTRVKQYIKEKYNKPGDVYLGLVHRLDRPVGGLMVFAKTSKAASRLSEQVRNRTFFKEYTAVVHGKAHQTSFFDHLVKNSKTNTSKVVSKHIPNAKYAHLDVTWVNHNKKYDLSKVRIHLHTGRSHQIRVQFASRNLPLWGDHRYHHVVTEGADISLFATTLEFDHPTTKKRLTFNRQTPHSFPFSLWKNSSN